MEEKKTKRKRPKTMQGRFSPKNPSKYKGNPTMIFYRSSWELKWMMKFDLHPNVVQWSSEETIVRYRSPLDNEVHRYFPDFVIKVRQPDGSVVTSMIEVKPLAQTKEPAPRKNTKRTSKTFIREVTTYAVNEAKWIAAKAYCEAHGWKFVILTEKDLEKI